MPGLRVLQAEELPAAAALQVAAFPDEPWSAEQLALILAMPGSLALVAAGDAAGVAAEDGGLRALLILRRAADEAEVLTLAVAPAWRRRGLARALLRRGLARLAAEGARTVFLEVGEDNAAALALYRRLGWRAAGRRKGYYRRGADALVMRLDLAGSGGVADEFLSGT